MSCCVLRVLLLLLQDLVEEDVMILDTFDVVFVWIGRGANEVEKKEALKSALEYIETDPSNRDVDSTLLIQVKQGFEPPTFSGLFLGWNPNLWAQNKTYEEYRAQITAGVSDVRQELKTYEEGRKLTYNELKGKQLPKGVDATKKEVGVVSVRGVWLLVCVCVFCRRTSLRRSFRLCST